jgi:RNA polymerase sigma-70 factor (ECF subfamily)
MVVRGNTQDINHLDGYIFKTASSVLADRHRRRTVRHADDHLAFDAEVHAELDFDAERTLLGKEALRSVSAALMTLPPRTRDIFLLRRVEGHRYQDIAIRIGISIKAVEKHMVRAVQHLTANSGDMR